jgi:hypothetical protein
MSGSSASSSLPAVGDSRGRCYRRAVLLTGMGRPSRQGLAGLAVAAMLGSAALPTLASAGPHGPGGVNSATPPGPRAVVSKLRHAIHYPGARQLRATARGPRVALGVAPEYPLSSVPAFNRLVGRPAKIVGLYQAWSEPMFYAAQLREIAAHHAFPLIAWFSVLDRVPIPLTHIIDGGEDALLRADALTAAAWKHIILVRLDSEMNLPGSIAGIAHKGNTPAKFVRAWRHVVRIFRQEHATNVKWVWSPNVACGGRCPFRAYYPGDRWVDWVALDGYNYAAVDHIRWYSFKRIFAGSYTTLSHLSDKPMMIGETASADGGGNKAAWISGMGKALARRFHRIRALVWFDRVKETNWKVDSTRASLLAFRRVVHSFPFTSR